MTTKAKETEQVKADTAEKSTVETNEQKASDVQPKSQIEDVTFVEPETHDTHDASKLEFEDNKENKAILKEDKELKESVSSGDTKVSFVSSATDLAELQRGMVPHPLSGKPVYATAFQASLAQSLKGEL